MNNEHRRIKLGARLRQPTLSIPAFGVLLIVALWVAVLHQLAVDRRLVLDRATHQTQDLAEAFEQHTLRVIKEADRVALRVKYEFELTGKVNLQEMVSGGVLSAEGIDGITIFDASGNVAGSSRSLPAINVADRLYFRRHVTLDEGKLDISEPFASRASQEPTVILSRRLDAVDETFAGIVALSVRPGYFTNFYQTPQLGKHGVIALLGREGTFKAWRIGDQVLTPDGRASKLFARSALSHAGSYGGESAIDGIDRLVAFRTLENHPIVIAAGLATDEVLADFHHQRLVYLAGAAAFTAAIVAFFSVMTVLVIRLKRGQAEIKTQQTFLQNLLDNLPVGVIVRSVRAGEFGRIVLWNSTNELIFGISRDRALGKTAAEIYPASNAARIETLDHKLLASPMVQENIERSVELPGHEGCLHIIRAPIFDAQDDVEYIVSITSDITQEQARADSARLASKVFETTTDAIIVSDAEDRVIMVNASFSRLIGINADEIVGRLLRESPFFVLDALAYEAHVLALTRNGHLSGEVLAPRKGGAPLPCWLSASCVLDPDGRIVNYIRVFTDISALKASQRKLEALTELFTNIVDNIPSAIQLKSVEDNYRIVMWNKAAEAMYGVSPQEAIGKSVHDLWPKEVADRFHSADLDLTASGGIQEDPDRSTVTKNRGTIRTHLRKVPLYDASGAVTHLLVMVDDNTERLAAAEELRNSEARFRSLLELSSDWYWEQDEEFRGTRRSGGEASTTGRAVAKFYGERRWEIEGATPVSGTWEGHKAIVNAHLPFRDFEYKVVQDNGRVSYRSVSGEPIFDQSGIFKGYRGVGRDVTEKKLAESELVRRNGELTELNNKLTQAQQQLLQSEKLASIGQLAAGVAHEINNPIGYVMSNFGTLEGYVHKLLELVAAYEALETALSTDTGTAAVAAVRERIELDYLREDIPPLIKECKEGITRVRKIVADLKDFSRTEGKQEWVWADLHDGIDSTLNIVANEIKYKADVVKEYGNLPEIECLPTQLNQVFMNLLVNAAQAVTKTRGRIIIRSGSDGDQVWIEVSDDGSGMPPEVKSRIFDPFFTTKPVGKGTGLGLSLAYGIIQKHRGRIDLESEVGKGTTFRVWLPIRHASDDEVPPTADPRDATLAAAMQA